MLKKIKKLIIFLLLIRAVIPFFLYGPEEPVFEKLFSEMLMWYSLFCLVLLYSLGRVRWTGRILKHSLLVRLLIFGILTRIIYLPNTISLIGTFAPLVVGLSGMAARQL